MPSHVNPSAVTLSTVVVYRPGAAFVILKVTMPDESVVPSRLLASDR